MGYAATALADGYEPPEGSGPLTERAQARVWAHRLSVEVEEGAPISTATIERFIRDAERRGWDEVARAGLYLAFVKAKREGRDAHDAALQRMLERAEADGDPVLTAMALAKRCRAASLRDDASSSVAADRDLARATVLLEGATGVGFELAKAHLNCAIAYGLRDLWELEQEHYQAAQETLGAYNIEHPMLPLAILYNLAEVQLNWACALRELGDTDALTRRMEVARVAVRAAEVPEMPPAWRDELRIFAALLGVMAPGRGGPSPEGLQAEGEYAGYVRLARALSRTDPEHALPEAEAAVSLIDADTCPNAHNLALLVASELEAAIAGSETAGLRYGRHLAHARWGTRLSSLATMQSLLHAERLRSEHALLSQHAYLDDLTRLGNRRALLRYVDGLVAEGVVLVAMVLVDLDRFKDVNDTYGHSVGDQTLVRLAGLLRAAVRVDDLAVRLGGDEFLLLLASASPDAARRRAAGILAEIASEPWEQIAPGLRVTASLGFACGNPQRLDRLSLAADAALYRSKAAGGNAVSEA